MKSKNTPSSSGPSASLMWTMLGFITALPQQATAAMKTGYAQPFGKDSFVKINYDAAIVIFENYFFVPNGPGIPKDVWCGLTNFSNTTTPNVLFNSQPSLRWKVADDKNDAMALYEQTDKPFAHKHCVGTFFNNSQPTLNAYETEKTDLENSLGSCTRGLGVVSTLLTLFSLGVIVTVAYKTGALGKVKDFVMGGCKRLEYNDIDDDQGFEDRTSSTSFDPPL